MKKLPVLLALAALIGGAVWWWQPPAPRRHPPGVLVDAVPEQGPVAEPLSWEQGGYRIEALATYRLRARVLHTRRYRFGREADLSPLDLLLGWGPMSDQAIVDQFQFKQGQRWGYWRYRQPPLPDETIAAHAANNHLIPADETVEEKLLELRAGDVVTLRGHLVEVTAEGGWKWRSSLSRDDRRGRSCELIRVEEVIVEPPPAMPPQ